MYTIMYGREQAVSICFQLRGRVAVPCFYLQYATEVELI